MNSNFTKLLLAAFAAFAFVISAGAQSDAQYEPLRITVNNPEAQGMSFDATRAIFGPRFSEPLTANLSMATDGITEPVDNDTWSPVGFYCCEPISNGDELSGTIAIVGRGVCEFGFKVKNAEDHGAIGAIIANRAPMGLVVGTHNPGLIFMAPGAVGDSVTIPGMFISYEDREVLLKLIETLSEPVNITVSADYMYEAAASYAYATPEGGVRTLDSIELILINRSDETIFDVTVTATITTPGGGQEALTVALDSLAPPAAENVSGELQVFFDGYNPTEVGVYTVEFTAATGSGDTPLDQESLTMEFEVTDDYTYRIDNGIINEYVSASINVAAYQGPANLVFNVGSMFRTGSTAVTASFGSFMITNPEELTPGLAFTVSVLSADPDGDGDYDNNADGVIDGLDFTVVTSGTYELSGAELPYDHLLVEFESPANLDPNRNYILMVSHNGLDDDNFFPPAFAVAGTQEHYSFGTVIELASPGAETYDLILDGYESWQSATALTGANDDAQSWPHGGLHPVIRMHLDGFSNTNNLPLLEDGKFTILGNPTGDLLKVGFQLDSPAEEVRMVVLDMMGKVVTSKRLENVLNETHIVDVRGLAAGTYLVTVVTPEGYRTKKFVVVK